jgi:hypothetical protein
MTRTHQALLSQVWGLASSSVASVDKREIDRRREGDIYLFSGN